MLVQHRPIGLAQRPPTLRLPRRLPLGQRRVRVLAHKATSQACAAASRERAGPPLAGLGANEPVAA